MSWWPSGTRAWPLRQSLGISHAAASCREATTPRKAELGIGSCSTVLGGDKQDGVAGKSTLPRRCRGDAEEMLRRCRDCSWQLCHSRSKFGGQAGMAASRAPQPGWGHAQAVAGTCCDQFATGAPAGPRRHAPAPSTLFCSLPVPQVFSTGL